MPALAFLSALLKDIRSERPKITEKDNLRLLYVTKWFLEYFLAMRSKEQSEKTGQDRWNFGLIAEVTERSWIIWVLKRMREAVEEKVHCQITRFIIAVRSQPDNHNLAQTMERAPSGYRVFDSATTPHR